MPSFAKLRRTGRADRSTSRMISSFSAAGYLMRRPPQPRSRFFSEAGSRTSALTPPPSAHWPPGVNPSPRLRSPPGRCRRPGASCPLLRIPSTNGNRGSARSPPPGPARRGSSRRGPPPHPRAPAQLGDAVLAAQSGQYDPDLLLGRELAPGGATDLFDNLLRRFLHRPRVLVPL